MKFFATSFAIVMLSVLLYTEAASICGGGGGGVADGASKVSAIQSDDSTTTASEKSLDVDEKSDGTAVTDTVTTSAPMPAKGQFSDVKKFFRTVQCTLEKAEPLVEEIEKEVKRFGESAKRFGEGFIHTITDLVEKLIVHRPVESLGIGNVAADEAATIELVEVVTQAAKEPIEGEKEFIKDDGVSSTSIASSTPIAIANDVSDENFAANEIPLSA